MKLVIAIDSFKGSMTSKEAGIAAAQGIRKVFPVLISVSALLQMEAKAQSLPSLKAWTALFVLSQ